MINLLFFILNAKRVKDNEYLGLEGVISVVLDDMFLVDTDGDHPGSYAFYVEELELIAH